MFEIVMAAIVVGNNNVPAHGSTAGGTSQPLWYATMRHLYLRIFSSLFYYIIYQGRSTNLTFWVKMVLIYAKPASRNSMQTLKEYD